MLLNIFILIAGFIILIKGGDIFVEGASKLAENFKVPKMVIGLTIVAFGTSAPELAVSISALAKDNSDMVLGNVIGSCILNILLILSVGAIIKDIKIKDNTVKKEIPLCLLVSILLVILFIDIPLNGTSINEITRSDGIVFLLFFSVFVYYLISLIKKKHEIFYGKPKLNKFKSTIYILLGLLGIIIGSELVTTSASNIAANIGISQRIISLTIVALGTSLPELVTTIMSAKKGETDLLVGNIIGSNIFNICIVLGLPVVIFGSITSISFTNLDLIMLVLSSLLLLIFSYSKKILTKSEGYILLVLFILYYTAICII